MSYNRIYYINITNMISIFKSNIPFSVVLMYTISKQKNKLIKN